MSGLQARLKQLQAARTGTQAPVDRPGPVVQGALPARRADGVRDSEPSRSAPPGWREAAPLVYVRDTEEDIPDLPELRAGDFTSKLLGGPVAPGALRFMDTETTGLSGGAGTVVFLVGAGVVEGSRLHIRQVLLGDFPGEPAFLEAALEVLGSGIWVSYNGKAFDARLLESRCIMNGIRPASAANLDLLTWTRRLWRTRLCGCSLGDIEEAVLNRNRADDIPGSEIPDAWFSYLRTDQPATLEKVFEHHRLDVVSLVHLFVTIERILGTPGRYAEAGEPQVDRFQLGRWLLGSDEAVAIRLLEAELYGGPQADRAALLLSRLYRRRGQASEAMRTLNAAGTGSPAVAVEMAKIYEHDVRDPAAALAVVERCLLRAGEPGAVRDELLHRRARLVRKALRSGGTSVRSARRQAPDRRR